MATKKNGKANGSAAAEGDAIKPGWQGDRDFTDAPGGDDGKTGDELLAEARDLAVSTLTGDLRDFILDRLKHEQSKMPWHQRSESDQRDTVHQVEVAVRSLVARAVELIAGHGRVTLKAYLDQITIKDGIKATLTMPATDPERHKLFDARGMTVLIVVADAEAFSGEREPVAIQPDQPELSAAVVHSVPDGAPEPLFN